MKKNVSKILIFVMLIIMSLITYAGCNSRMKINEFSGLENLPRNPIRIIFATNSQNFNNDTNLYGEPIEYEIQSDKISKITEELFAISYKAEPKSINIDMSPVIRTLILINAEGVLWTVRLGLQRYNERWYSPIHDEELISLLYESITK